ncbi:MAG: 6-pyruvoyl-tetrahydropterin synthase-related protein [Chloroflexota bacterium]
MAHPLQELSKRPRSHAWLSQIPTALGLAALALLASTPLWGPGLPDTGDALLHLYRVVELQESVAAGDMYPRWAPNFIQGLGYPIFNFYAPLTYYLWLAGHSLGLTYVVSLKVLLSLCFLVSGVGAFYWVRQLVGDRGALLAAAAYVFAPYRLGDAYVRGDVAELLALAWLPLVLWGFHRLVDKPTLPRALVAAAPYALLILSHNLTAFFFTPLLLIYVLVRWWPYRSPSGAIFVGLALLLAVGLTMFYWLPALIEKDLVQLERALRAPNFDVHSHFVPWRDLLSPQLPIDRRLGDVGIPTKLSTAQVILALLGLALLLVRPHAHRATLLVLAFLTPLLTFLITPGSASFWSIAPLVEIIQFPWRLLGLASLFLAALIGVAASPLLESAAHSQTRHQQWLASLWFAVVLLAVVLPSFVLLYPTERKMVPANVTVADALSFERTSGALGTTGGEYLPLTVETLLDPSPLAAAYEGQGTLERLNRTMLPAGVSAELLQRRGDYESYRFRSDKPTTILLNLLHFPFWHAYVDGVEVPTEVYRPYGLLSLTVAEGERLVEIRRQATPLAQGATAVSWVALGVCGILALLAALRARPSSAPKPILASAGRSGAGLFCLVLVALLIGKVWYVDGQTDWFRQHSTEGVAPGSQHQLAVDFGGVIDCIGYDLNTRALRAGEALQLRLYWEAREPLDSDYSVMVHLVSAPGQPPVAQEDSLHPANIPTSRWVPGKYVPDQHDIALSPQLAPGEYELIIGLYDPRPGGKRLSVDGAGGEQAHFTLGKIVVAP